MKKAKFFLSAGSIGRSRNWGYVKYFTPKNIYKQARDIIRKAGTKKVQLGFSEPMEITSILINY
jgi:hypothetical protein